jgi:hypothetical protein
MAQAGDGPISKEDAMGLAGVLKNAKLVLDDFFELLRDVPEFKNDIISNRQRIHTAGR